MIAAVATDYTDWGAGGFAVLFIFLAVVILSFSLEVFKGMIGPIVLTYIIGGLLLIFAIMFLIGFFRSVSK
jgi:hypothetical protein